MLHGNLRAVSSAVSIARHRLLSSSMRVVTTLRTRQIAHRVDRSARPAFKQREPRAAGADVGPAEAAGLSVRRHLCWKGVAQRQNIPRPRAPSSPSIAVGRRLRPTTPRPCGSCAAALVARRRSPSRWSPYTPAATTCRGPRARGVVSTLERHSGRAMGAAFTWPTAIVSGSACARPYGVGHDSTRPIVALWARHELFLSLGRLFLFRLLKGFISREPCGTL